MDSRSSGGSGRVRFGSLSRKPSLGPQKRGTMAAALSTLLLQLAEGEDHVHCGPAGSEAALRLRVDTRSEAL